MKKTLGVFALALLTSASPARASITFVDVFKTNTYIQNSNSAPTTSKGYFGAYNVNSNNSTDLTGATVFNNSSDGQVNLTGSNGNYAYVTELESKKALDATISGNSASFLRSREALTTTSQA